ncbi:MAG: hypothetical protein IPM58_15125 [Nitrospira sp.]|nr:hypothetical protein [Nitrospira sp.]
MKENEEELRKFNPLAFLIFFRLPFDGCCFLSSLAHMKTPAILSLMRSSKYILWQDDNGWRGYLEGYPEYEVQGESFEELQVKLWQLHQELSSQEQEQEQYQTEEENQSHSHTPTMSRPTSRPMPRAFIQRRARVEQLIFAMISNR